MNKEMKQNHEERIDDMLRNLSSSQQIIKLKELLLDAYDDSYNLARRSIKAIKYIENEEIDVTTIRFNDIQDVKQELLDILKGSDK